MILSRLLSLAALICYSYVAELNAEELTSIRSTSSKLGDSAPVSPALTADSLFGLLVAEFASSRRLNDVALKYYTQQAIQTRAPKVAERATALALYMNNNAAAQQMSQLWVETAPNDEDALTSATLILIQAGRLLQAFEISKCLQTQNNATLFQNIAASANDLTPAQREPLLQRFKNLLQQHSQDEQLLVGTGLLLQQQNRFDDALNYAKQALSIYPQSIPAAMLEVNTLHALKRDRDAIAKMSTLLMLYPANTNLRSQYAQTLTHHDIALAQQQFSILADQLPNNADMNLSLGVIAMERKDYKTARKAFERLLDTNQQLSSAHYYLGQIAEKQHYWQDAIINYLQVEPANEFLLANTKLLDIFIRTGDLVSAQEHLNRARIRYPDQAKDLYLLHAQVLIKHHFFNHADAVLNEALALYPGDRAIINLILSANMERLNAENAAFNSVNLP